MSTARFALLCTVVTTVESPGLGHAGTRSGDASAADPGNRRDRDDAATCLWDLERSHANAALDKGSPCPEPLGRTRQRCADFRVRHRS